jgi:hypothetical protein
MRPGIIAYAVVLIGFNSTVALGCARFTVLGIGAAKLVPKPESGAGTPEGLHARYLCALASRA